MKILYHLTVLPPRLPEAEALSQEIEALRRHFAGEIHYLNPNIVSPVYLPRLLFGWHKLPEIWRLEKAIDLHHLYNPDPFPFPALRLMRQPVVYTISSGVGPKRPHLGFFSRLPAITVPDRRSYDRLRGWGLSNVYLVRPGIDGARFSHSPQPLGKIIRLLVASAPWTRAQFQSKGIDALLALASQQPHLELLFLWRGHLLDEMRQRVARQDVADRVKVLDRLVNVNEVLATVHATVNLASEAGIVKAYPHSLLDSLAAGKPVLVSQAIPMADYVAQTGCGVVVETVSPESIGRAVDQLMADYKNMETTAVRVGQRDFSQAAMIDSYRQVYQSVLASEARR